MKKLILALLLALCSSANAQGPPVKQSGGVTPGHAVQWLTSGVIKDAGTATQGFLTSIGVTASQPGICQNSGPITAPYNQICLNATGAGGGFVFTSFGGAIGTPTFTINGNTYEFPFNVAIGGITGPNPTIVGDVPTWNNTLGTLLSGPGTLHLENTSGVERQRITSLGAVIFNKSSTVYTSPIDAATIDVIGDGTFGGGISLFSNNHHSNLAYFDTVGATPTTQGALVANNTIGTESWYGSDGVAFQSGAFFQAAAESTWSAGSAPTFFNWWTAASGSVAPVVRMVFGSTGNLSIGDFTDFSGSGQAYRSLSGRPLEIVKSANQPWYVAYAFANDNSNVPALVLRKSRSTTVGTQTAVQNGDNLFILTGQGSDGTTFQAAADIFITVDAAVSSSIVPGRLVFQTANASGVLTQALKLDSSQVATFASTVIATGYTAGVSAGVSCSGSPTSGFVSVNGIVTHC